MKKHLTILAAACTAIGSFSLVARADDVKPNTDVRNNDTSKAKAPTKLPDGIVSKDLKEDDDIRGGLATLVNRALTAGDFSKFTNRFVDADRNRLDKFAGGEHKELDGTVAAFRKQWKDKYGQDFDADANKVFNNQGFATLLQGEISDPAMLSNWPIDPTPDVKAPKEQAGDAAGKDANGNTAGDRNLEKGRNVALYSIAESHGAPMLNVSLIHELPDSWVVDIPDNLDGPQLERNLKDQLYTMGQKPEAWPTNIEDAYRMVAHHVLMACYNVPANTNANGNANINGNTNTGGNSTGK